jgi:ABC-2 type transport system ATP-binding protein
MRYGPRRGRARQPAALSDVSFEVGRGEIVALLGPNGAGKTTIMRILSGFLDPTDGDAELAGHSVRADGLAVRRQVGYLPEGVPLYPDMRVGEYLDYRARLRGVARSQRARLIDRAIDECGLGDRRRQIVGTLSRGYRQRVGLCDAILARPPILILDEPTVGLDPNQIRDVRELIRTLGREHTVLLSTHILPEVEALAARVVILHRGCVVAGGSPGEAGGAEDGTPSGTARLLVAVRPEQRALAAALLRALPDVSAVDELSDGRLALSRRGPPAGASADSPPADLRDQVFRAAVDGGFGLRELRWETTSLEEIFTRITTTSAPPPDTADA